MMPGQELEKRENALRMAIKFARLYGKEIRIIGKNGETLSAAAAD